jgi:hypothetical protein
MKNSNNWQEDIRSKLASSQGIHCEQARLLAEYAAVLVRENAADKQQRIKWLLAQARENGFNLKLSVTDDGVTYTWMQRRVRFTYRQHTEGIAQMHIALSGLRSRKRPDG